MKKSYEDLIKKAIIEVVDASKSSTKGTKDNPVFFISYKNETKNIFGRNYFISKKEIEEIFKN